MIQLEEYVDARGASPFREWFDMLDAVTAARIAVGVTRLEQGNFSRTKGIGGGVLELKFEFGPGYRVYFGRDGDSLVLLLAGGNKRRQDKDIAAAQARWSDYKQRKKAQ
jgi:putative addiction module killer protein